VSSTGAGCTAGQNLRTLGNELTKTSYVLIIDNLNTVYTEVANLLVGLSAHRSVFHFDASFIE
jgi:hypothetical protein